MTFYYQKISKYKYRLAESEARKIGIKGLNVHTQYVSVWPSGNMVIHRGYAWNGSNWSIDYKSIEASCWHDAGYQLMRMGLIGQEHREYFDKLYRDILLEKGLWKWHANFRYMMLRNFGGTGAKLTDKPQNPIYEE